MEIKIEVRLFANLQRYYCPERKPGEAWSLAVGEGTTLKQLVEERLSIPREAVKTVFVNGRSEDDDYILADGDRVGIFPPVAGGNRFQSPVISFQPLKAERLSGEIAMLHKFPALLLGVLSLAFLVSCTPLEKVWPTPGSAEDTSASPLKDFTSPDGAFSLPYPADWSVGQVEDGAIFSTSREMAQDSRQLREGATFLLRFAEGSGPKLKLEDSLDALLARLQKHWKEVKIGAKGRRFLGGEEAVGLFIRARDATSDLEFAMYMAVLDHGPKRWLFLALAPSEHWEEVWPTFAQMMEGFRFSDVLAGPVRTLPTGPGKLSLELEFGLPGAGPGKLNSPIGLAVDREGNICVADRLNRRVQKFDSQGQYLWEKGNFDQIQAVALDGEGNLYVLDQGTALVYKFDRQGNPIAEIGGLGEAPSDLVVDRAGNIYVTEGRNASVRKFSPDGLFLKEFGGEGAGKLQQPWGIALSKTGDIYVSDAKSGQIKIFDTQGDFLLEFGRFGASGPGKFKQPRGIAIDDLNNVYVADRGSDRVQVFDPRGEFLFEISSGFGSPQDPGLDGPEDVFIDQGGYIYIADRGHNRILKFRLD